MKKAGSLADLSVHSVIARETFVSYRYLHAK
jgi:hypothetical protein